MKPIRITLATALLSAGSVAMHPSEAPHAVPRDHGLRTTSGWCGDTRRDEGRVRGTGWPGGELVDRLSVGVDEGAHPDAPSSLRTRRARA
jgi:hypothetical protein